MRLSSKIGVALATTTVGLALALPSAALAQQNDNTDPAAACSSNSYTLTSAPVRRKDTNAIAGTVEIRWSRSCNTGWSRFTPASGVYPVFAEVDVTRPADNARTEKDVRNYTDWPLYSNQLNGSASCLTAHAYITIDGPNGNISADGTVGCAGGAQPANSRAETTGGTANTWTNYQTASGTQGPTIGANATVYVACKVTGKAVPDGNTWWYRVASNPWANSYYTSADAFYNNGATSGSLSGTPFVDTSVPNC